MVSSDISSSCNLIYIYSEIQTFLIVFEEKRSLKPGKVFQKIVPKIVVRNLCRVQECWKKTHNRNDQLNL